MPSNLKVVNSPAGLAVVWDAVYHAYGYRIKTRAAGGDWGRYNISANRHDPTWAVEGEEIEYSVASACRDIFTSLWTDVVSRHCR
jgi:hypothetical protein